MLFFPPLFYFQFAVIIFKHLLKCADILSQVIAAFTMTTTEFNNYMILRIYSSIN